MEDGSFVDRLADLLEPFLDELHAAAELNGLHEELSENVVAVESQRRTGQAPWDEAWPRGGESACACRCHF